MPTLESTTPVERSASFMSNAASWKLGSRWRVLIVNADASIREMIRSELERHSDLIEVVGEASDGEEAIAQAGFYPIDLVLMDIHLSPMNSIDATRELKRMLPQVVIVGVSLEYSPLLYNAMISEGVVAFVNKEDAADLLFRTIVFAMCTYHPTHVPGNPMHIATL